MAGSEKRSLVEETGATAPSGERPKRHASDQIRRGQVAYEPQIEYDAGPTRLIVGHQRDPSSR